MRNILKYHPFIQMIISFSVILQWKHAESNTHNSFSIPKISIIKRLLFIISLFVPSLTFAQTSEPNTDMCVTNASVYAIAVDSDYTYIGGNFTYVGPNISSGAVLTTSNSLPNLTFPRVNGRVEACIPDGSGGWIIGGRFSEVGKYTRNHIAHINSDATVDESWDPNANNTVYAIAIIGGDIYVGGDFTSIGGQIRNRIAKLYISDDKADPSWNPNANGWINSIATNGDDI